VIKEAKDSHGAKMAVSTNFIKQLYISWLAQVRKSWQICWNKRTVATSKNKCIKSLLVCGTGINLHQGLEVHVHFAKMNAC